MSEQSNTGVSWPLKGPCFSAGPALVPQNEEGPAMVVVVVVVDVEPPPLTPLQPWVLPGESRGWAGPLLRVGAGGWPGAPSAVRKGLDRARKVRSPSRAVEMHPSTSAPRKPAGPSPPGDPGLEHSQGSHSPNCMGFSLCQFDPPFGKYVCRACPVLCLRKTQSDLQN